MNEQELIEYIKFTLKRVHLAALESISVPHVLRECIQDAIQKSFDFDIQEMTITDSSILMQKFPNELRDSLPNEYDNENGLKYILMFDRALQALMLRLDFPQELKIDFANSVKNSAEDISYVYKPEGLIGEHINDAIIYTDKYIQKNQKTTIPPIQSNQNDAQKKHKEHIVSRFKNSMRDDRKTQLEKFLTKHKYCDSPKVLADFLNGINPTTPINLNLDMATDMAYLLCRLKTKGVIAISGGGGYQLLFAAHTRLNGHEWTNGQIHSESRKYTRNKSVYNSPVKVIDDFVDKLKPT
mgnify:CR=1 FL=1